MKDRTGNTRTETGLVQNLIKFLFGDELVLKFCLDFKEDIL